MHSYSALVLLVELHGGSQVLILSYNAVESGQQSHHCRASNFLLCSFLMRGHAHAPVQVIRIPNNYKISDYLKINAFSWVYTVVAVELCDEGRGNHGGMKWR